MTRSTNRENSLDCRAADAINQLQANNEALEAENRRLEAENRTLREGKLVPAAEAEQQVEAQDALLALAPALGLRKVAELLGVSYTTVYVHKEKLGFFQVGNQWRVWPEKLKEMTSGSPPQPAGLR
ncbi:helix-turn-helix domain-containing protein [Paraburkholderia lycopersici]|nr:helix-turn-helix domain-containing protein [Paraburkholderia lycopersici]